MTKDEPVIPTRVTIITGRDVRRTLFMAQPSHVWRDRLKTLAYATLIVVGLWLLGVAASITLAPQ
jgi:hypothetical protein